MMKKSFVARKIALFLAAMMVAPPALWAAVDVALAQPDWVFVLQNQPVAEVDMRLEPTERAFAQRIQPLLAAERYDDVLKAFDGRELAGDSAALRLLRGQVLLSLKRYDQAERVLRAALELAPRSAAAHRSLSVNYMVQKRYDQARHHLVRTIELGMADAQVYGQLAFVNLQNGQAYGAVTGYQQALYLEPDNDQWRKGLLYALMNSHAIDQAQALAEEMLTAKPDDSNLWLVRSQLALQQGRQTEALASLEAAFRLGDTVPANQILVAQLHLKTGSPARAVDLLSSSLARAGANTDLVLLEAVEQAVAWLVYQQRWQGASRLLQATDQIWRDLPSAYQAKFDVYRAQQAMQAQEPKKARQWLRRSLEADPTSGEALLALAGLYQQGQRFDEASNFFVRAEALKPFQERALLGRAQLEIDRKAYPEALRLLRLAYRQNPARNDLLDNIRSLEQLSR